MKCVPVHHGIPAVLHRDEPWLHRHSENGALLETPNAVRSRAVGIGGGGTGGGACPPNNLHKYAPPPHYKGLSFLKKICVPPNL